MQEALGYDLAESLFAQPRNLALEGLTDFWYLEATSELLRSAGLADLNDRIELIPCSGAGKLVYYTAILQSHKLKVAALFASDPSGAAKQEQLAHKLGHRGIIRVRDAYAGKVKTPQIEDLLRATLIRVAKESLGWDVSAEAASHPEQPIVDVFASQITGFSRYKLAKAYVRWTREHDASELEADERTEWFTLIGKINSALR